MSDYLSFELPRMQSGRYTLKLTVQDLNNNGVVDHQEGPQAPEVRRPEEKQKNSIDWKD